MNGKREREYSPDEAMAITLKRVTPHWYRSHPLLVGVVTPEKSYAQPLSPELSSGPWVFFTSACASAETGAVIEALKVWQTRYENLGVKFIFAFSGEYAFLKDHREMESWLKNAGVHSIAVWDERSEIAQSLGVSGGPGAAILHQGKIRFHSASPHWLDGGEKVLHEILREDSPGLSFWKSFQLTKLPSISAGRYLTHEGSPDLALGKVELTGDWRIDETGIFTSDSRAEILVHALENSVEFVAQSLSDAGDPTRVKIDHRGTSFSDAFAGTDFVIDDEGSSGVVLGGPRAYSVLRNIPPDLRALRFQFPFAKISPVAVYGFGFSKSFA